jgi:hypothetical protein
LVGALDLLHPHHLEVVPSGLNLQFILNFLNLPPLYSPSQCFLTLSESAEPLVESSVGKNQDAKIFHNENFEVNFQTWKTPGILGQELDED